MVILEQHLSIYFVVLDYFFLNQQEILNTILIIIIKNKDYVRVTRIQY